MLSEFNNLPGIYVNKDDGNLRILETIPGGVTVVLGTAPDGPLGRLYLVTDTGAAERVFDPDSDKTGTLMRGMFEAFESGAQYVALYRVGGSPLALDFVNGYTIVTNDSSESAGTKYKLYYTNDSSGVEVIRIYDASTGAILYDNVADIDNGQFTVYGTQVNSSSTPITIGGTTAATSPTFAAIMDFTDSDYAIGSAVVVTAVASTKTFTTSSSIFKAGQVVEIAALGGTGNTGHFVVSHVTLTSSTYTVTLSSKVSYSSGVISEVAWTGFVTDADLAGTAQVKVKYVGQTTGLDLSLNELFQAYARAYWELEAAKVDMVVPTGVFFNEANVVNNEGQWKQDQAGYTQPSGSYLGKGYEFEYNGQLYFAFKDSFTSAADLTATTVPTPYELGIDGWAAAAWLEKTHSFDTAVLCSSSADVSAAADDIAYQELNFGYQLAAYLDGLSANDNEASGVIAMKSPQNFSKAAISNWLGVSPTVDAADGTIVRSGTGLLGYKHMAGSLGVAKGLFRTSNGYFSGTAVLDRNNMAIDIGKYIDVISTPLLVTSAYDGTSTGYLSPSAGVYSGVLMGLEPNQSPLNQKVKGNVRLPFPLAKKYLDSLVATNYVAFSTTPEGTVKVVDAPTAALTTSDYNRRAVCRIAWATVDAVRAVSEPYIGKMTSAVILQHLEDQINGLLRNLQAPEKGWLIAGMAQLKQTRAMSIRGEAALKLTLYTANELRRLTIYLGLQK